jgi:calcium-dependent protein kinase
MGCGTIRKNPGAAHQRQSIILFPGQFVQNLEESIYSLYEFKEELGVGSYGRVVLGVKKSTREKRAIKIVNKLSIKNEEIRKKITTEVEIQRRLDHPNIVRVFEFYEDEFNLYIVMELCTGGELLDSIARIGCLSENQASLCMKQIFSAVSYLHSLRIVHRDLKLENMLVEKQNSSHFKIADFGIATELQGGKSLSLLIGTINYIAPEVIHRKYKETCDLWSCGVIMYILLSGSLPFQAGSKRRTLDLIVKGEFFLSGNGWDQVSEDAKELITRLLEVNPKKRITAKDAMGHRWIVEARAPNVRASLIQTTANNIVDFRETNKLQRAVIRFIASQLLNQGEKHELVSIFKTIDKTGDGKINEEDLKNHCLKVFGHSLSVEEIHLIMTRVDTDKSGFIDYSEFLAAAMDRKKLLSEEKLEAAFKAFDKDGNGKITAQELKNVLEANIKYDISVFSQIIEQVDKNGDGVIDFQEFKDMMNALATD